MTWLPKLIRRIAVALAFAGLVLTNLNAAVIELTAAAPPVEGGSIVSQPVRLDGSAKRLGPCWWREHRSQHVLYVEGDPFTMGYCNSRLAGPVMERQEGALHTALNGLVPFRPLRTALVRTLSFIYRKMPLHLSTSHRTEIAGLAEGYSDPYRHLGATYGRILTYHAIHDVSQAMVDNPILACSAFAASGEATVDGHTLLARNFDFEGGRVFDEDKVTIFTRPDYGIPFVSVAWAGMAGAVSGMNAEGIGVVLNAAGSDDLALEGTPTTLVLRDILQFASSIDDAVDIIERSRVFVTDIFTLADGKTGELAVVEVTPEAVAVSREAPVIYATNHLRHPTFKDDEENGKRMLGGTTISRFNRLAELVEAHRGELDPLAAQSILRDRKLPGNVDAPLGHRGTIDALIASHAVIFDLTGRRFWVSSSPHTLGEFVEYDFDEAMQGQTRDLGALPADPMLTDGRWANFQAAETLMAESDGLDGPPRVSRLRSALELAADHPGLLVRLAEACDAIEDDACSRETWARVLSIEPPYRKTATKAEGRLQELAQ
ncbi:MAG: hypothetical protein ACI9OJ_004877 [Myxococcota bacterium]|jgi:hypothetical protein